LDKDDKDKDDWE